MLIVSSTRFQEHVTPPGHPERVERAHVFDAVATDWRARGTQVVEPSSATKTDIERAHAASLVGEIEASAGHAVMLDGDTFTSPETYAIALLAAGAAIQGAQHAVDSNEIALALVRPPGHHAERARAMGFCFFNNVAIAAAAMLARGLTRIAIVDIDVHHGNGTQDIFYNDPRVLYISTHQYPFYPGTGAAHETGAGEGRGFTANVPMEAGCGDADYQLVYGTIVAPLLQAFDPELTIVSAGFDAHERDPLASMRLTTGGYREVIHQISAACGSRALAVVTEGGYDLTALGDCLRATCEELSGAPAVSDGAAGAVASSSAARGARAVTAARQALEPLWPGVWR